MRVCGGHKNKERVCAVKSAEVESIETFLGIVPFYFDGQKKMPIAMQR